MTYNITGPFKTSHVFVHSKLQENSFDFSPSNSNGQKPVPDGDKREADKKTESSAKVSNLQIGVCFPCTRFSILTQLTSAERG